MMSVKRMSLGVVLGLLTATVLLPAQVSASEGEESASVINELRLGRSVYKTNCIQCHSASTNKKAKNPSARGYWAQKLNTKGVHRMTSSVSKTHIAADGIGPYVFEDVEMLRGAVRYLAIGGEAYFDQTVEGMKAVLSQRNQEALNKAIKDLGAKNVVLWGKPLKTYQHYSYIGPNYPLSAALGETVAERMAEKLKDSLYIPSLRGEFEPRRDYEQRVSDERALHNNRYKKLLDNEAMYRRFEAEQWLNVIAGQPRIPINFKYNPDEEHFHFEIWHTPKRFIAEDDTDTDVVDAGEDSLTLTIDVPLEVARHYKRRLENEDIDSKPTLHVAYTFQESKLILAGVIILWRDTNETEVIGLDNIEGSLVNIVLSDNKPKKKRKAGDAVKTVAPTR